MNARCPITSRLARAAWLLGALALALAAGPLRAEATPRDVQLLARALGFVDPLPARGAVLAIVYAAGDPAARAAAERLAAGEPVRLGVVPLRLAAVSVGEAVDLARSRQVAALLLTESALPEAERIARGVAGTGVLTAATEPGPVERDRIVLAVRAAPRVEILASRSAARDAGIGFAAAFRMMIQER